MQARSVEVKRTASLFLELENYLLNKNRYEKKTFKMATDLVTVLRVIKKHVMNTENAGKPVDLERVVRRFGVDDDFYKMLKLRLLPITKGGAEEKMSPNDFAEMYLTYANELNAVVHKLEIQHFINIGLGLDNNPYVELHMYIVAVHQFEDPHEEETMKRYNDFFSVCTDNVLREFVISAYQDKIKGRMKKNSGRVSQNKGATSGVFCLFDKGKDKDAYGGEEVFEELMAKLGGLTSEEIFSKRNDYLGMLESHDEYFSFARGLFYQVESFRRCYGGKPASVLLHRPSM